MGPMARIKHDVAFTKSSSGGATTSDNYSIWSSSSECSTGGKDCYVQVTRDAGASIPMEQGGHVPPNIYEGGDINGNVPPIF